MTINATGFKTLLVKHQKNILHISLNRPEKKNAISPAMTNELLFVLDFADKNDSVRVLDISAQGDVFCAGGDLRNMSGEENNEIPNMDGNLADVIKKLRNLNKPVVCRIEGNVYAGALLLVCNSTHAYALDNVTFTAPEIKRGIWPFMVMAGLFRVMPKRAGLDFIMRGNAIDTNQALTHGLINQHFGKNDFQIEVDKITNELASMPPNAMKKGLLAFNKQEFNDFDNAMNFLESEINDSLKSDEAKEGITAFLEKREPNWK
jgi:enoyl-CoA hydratase/carnithine racemase|tara:strand:- start:6493 stop:7278 length:786 start_codon:yes stop_codon:yes gene_type:complete